MKHKELVKMNMELYNKERIGEEINKDDFKPDGNFKPVRKMNHNQFYALIEGVDFKITQLGKIIRI